MGDYTTVMSYILIGAQGTWGTAVVPSKDVGLVQSFKPNNERIYHEGRSITARNPQVYVAGKAHYGFSLTAQHQHGRMLYYALGAVGHSGSSDPYTHTITESDTLPMFTLEDGFNSSSDTVLRYDGCKVNTLTYNIGEGPITFSADCIAGDLVQSTTAQASVTDTLPIFDGQVHTDFKVGADTAEASLTDVKNLTLTISNGLVENSGINSYEAESIDEGIRTYKISGTARFTRDDEMQGFFDGYASAATEMAENPTAFSTIIDIQNTANRAIYFKFQNCHFTSLNQISDIGQNSAMFDFEIIGRTLASCYTKDDIASGSW